MTGQNVERKKGFNQVCVWPGTLIAKDEIPSFEAFVEEQVGAKAQFLETIVTGPGDDGEGGRADVFFAVCNDDISATFATCRLQYGIRWVEDVLADINYNDPIYPERVFGYKMW